MAALVIFVKPITISLFPNAGRLPAVGPLMVDLVSANDQEFVTKIWSFPRASTKRTTRGKIIQEQFGQKK